MQLIRPKPYKVISVSLRHDVLKQLDSFCFLSKRKRSHVIAQAVLRMLADKSNGVY